MTVNNTIKFLSAVTLATFGMAAPVMAAEINDGATVSVVGGETRVDTHAHSTTPHSASTTHESATHSLTPNADGSVGETVTESSTTVEHKHEPDAPTTGTTVTTTDEEDMHDDE